MPDAQRHRPRVPAAALNDAMELCPHIEPIGDRELREGNEVESVLENAYAKVDLLVMLKRPFHAYYEDQIDTSRVIVSYDTDPHYPVGKSYFCEEHRQAIFGPQEFRR